MSRREQINRTVFLKNIIREYYARKPLEEPSMLHKREIALESLEDGVYIRHLAFPYMNLLYEYITKQKTPLHLYYSSALYTTPDASKMEDKVWEGSELIFDIDADKYPGCEKKIWICPSTGEIYQEEVESCRMGGKPVEYSFLDWTCIEKAWQDVLSLVEILTLEYGFSNIKVYFSGNRGFHVRVLDEQVYLLSREARRAIADYVSCEGLDRDRMFPSLRGSILFTQSEYGLRRRVLEKARVKGIVVKKEVDKSRKPIIYEAIDSTYLDELLNEVCIKIDKAVTMDTSRLSRFGNSLNMKAGLRVREVSLNTDIHGINYSYFSPFKGFIKVKSLVTGEFNALDSKVSLSHGETIKLEAHIGLYLVIKQLVYPVDYSELEVKL